VQTFIDNVLKRLQEVFDPATLGDQFADALVDVSVVLIILLVFYLLWRLVRLVVRTSLKRTPLDQTAESMVQKIVQYSILGAGAIVALSAAGTSISTLLASVGVVGLTIGFAAKDALSNLIAGFLIFIDRPFVIGDLVEISGHYGQVEEIKLRSTRIVTSNGLMLTIPNTEVINEIVASYTNYPHLRLDVKVTIAVDEDISRVRELLLSLVEDDDRYMTSPAPRVLVTELNDYNVAMELQAWIHEERKHVPMRSELREKAYTTLIDAGVDMPFETLRLAPIRIASLDAEKPPVGMTKDTEAAVSLESEPSDS
jgi:small conductance mechanosensitive channel